LLSEGKNTSLFFILVLHPDDEMKWKYRSDHHFMIDRSLCFLRDFNDRVINGTIFDTLAAAGCIAFGRIDHTDLIQIIDCPAFTKMDTRSTPDTLFF
jgi:hypothetical protein